MTERNGLILCFCAYILKSEKDGRYYYGSCEDLEIRVAKHNSGQVKATKYRAPFILHYKEEFLSRSGAFKREQFFKSVDGHRWLKDNNIT
ncbi:MAG: GIY-YIG nuclease family protein [Ferruginibacter sp.]